MDEELYGKARNGSKALLKSHLNMGDYHKRQNLELSTQLSGKHLEFSRPG